MALHPGPMLCAVVRAPSAVVSPYSYQYVVGTPLGVTFPVTTAVEFDGVAPESVTTVGTPAVGCAGGGVTVVPPSVVGGVEVAVVPSVAGFMVRRKYPPPRRTSTTTIPIMTF